MIDYIIGEEVKLPSNGKLYNTEINPYIKLRSMTTAEEMKRLSRSDRPNKVLADLIDDCTVTNIGMSSYDMCFADFQYLLHQLRIITYGPEYRVYANCSYCNSVIEDSINLNDLPVVEFDEDLLKYLEVELPITKYKIKLRMQTPRLLDDVDLQVKDMQRRRSSYENPAFFFNLKALIQEVNGERPDPLKLEEFIMELPMLDVQVIMRSAEKFNEGFGVSTDGLILACGVCGLESIVPFRITSEFFGPTIDI